MGQSISLTGTWMQQVAMGWLVYRITNSALLLGVVGFCSQIPSFFLAPIAGIVADRYNRREVLIITQALAMIQALIISILVLYNTIKVWQIMVLSSFLGLINALDSPVRQSFTVDMIENREDLGNAIALNSSMFNGARLIGPSVAGILIAWAGEGICFLLNAISYIAVIASLLSMRMKTRGKRIIKTHVIHELKEGAAYVFGSRPIRTLLLLLALVSLVGVPLQVLMPVFARDIFHGGPKTLGLLVAVTGLGALFGTFYLASRKSVLGLARVIARSTALFGAGLVIFSFSKILWFSVPVTLLCGFGMMVQMAGCNTVLQTIVDEDKRGRLMSFYILAFIGTVPFGSLLAGGLAGKIGAPFTLLISGLCCIAAVLIYLRNIPSLEREILPIYAKKGIATEAVMMNVGA